MAKNVYTYSLGQVESYMSMCRGIEHVDVIEGALLDTYIIHHECGVTEVFEVVCRNEWSSAYVRHIYRKRVPKRFQV